MDVLAGASRIRLQRAKASNYRHATYRHYLNFANADKSCTEKKYSSKWISNLWSTKML